MVNCLKPMIRKICMIPKFREGNSDATGVCALVLAAMRKDAATGAPSNPSKRKRRNVAPRKRKLFEDTPQKRKIHVTPIATAHKTDDPITPGVAQPPPQKKMTLMATPIDTAHQTDDPLMATPMRVTLDHNPNRRC